MAASFTRERRADELAENVADALARALAAAMVSRFRREATQPTESMVVSPTGRTHRHLRLVQPAASGTTSCAYASATKPHVGLERR
jgi:hypothetical protein